MVTLQPTGDKLLVNRHPEKSNSGIILPESAKRKPDVYNGMVLCKGRGSALHNLKELSQGMTVTYPSNAAVPVPEELMDRIKDQFDLVSEELDIVEFDKLTAINGHFRGERVIANRIVENLKGKIIVQGEEKTNKTNVTAVVLVKGKSDSKGTLYDIIHVGDVFWVNINDCTPIPDALKEIFNIKGDNLVFVNYEKILATI